MFDAVAIIVLAVAFVRSARARFDWGMAASASAVAIIVGTAVSALGAGAGKGNIAVPLGVFFVGPGAILHERSGALAFFAAPIAVASSLVLLTAVPSAIAGRRRDELHPDTEMARAPAGVSTAFVGALTFGALRLIVAVMFAIMANDIP